jgi:hypothetical protein
MFLSFLPRPTAVINISSTTSDYNLRSQASSPNYPLNLLCFINANLTASSNTIPAFRTGPGWSSGTWIYIDNNATITGGGGSSGSIGANGSNGAGGAGGAGAPVSGSATTGSNGGRGANGANGTAGANGGIAFQVDSSSSTIIVIDNAGGIITGGSGGNGGTGGIKGQGGGGGGGGGGWTQT